MSRLSIAFVNSGNPGPMNRAKWNQFWTIQNQLDDIFDLKFEIKRMDLKLWKTSLSTEMVLENGKMVDSSHQAKVGQICPNEIFHSDKRSSGENGLENWRCPNKYVSCDLCPNTFASRKSLSSHKRTHSQVKKYKCKRFRTRAVESEFKSNPIFPIVSDFIQFFSDFIQFLSDFFRFLDFSRLLDLPIPQLHSEHLF